MPTNKTITMTTNRSAISDNAIWRKYRIPPVWFEMAGKMDEWDLYDSLPEFAPEIVLKIEEAFCINDDRNRWLVTVTINDKLIAFNYYSYESVDDLQSIENSWMRWIREYYEVVSRSELETIPLHIHHNNNIKPNDQIGVNLASKKE